MTKYENFWFGLHSLVHTFLFKYLSAQGINFINKSLFFIDAKGAPFFRPDGQRITEKKGEICIVPL